MRNGSRVVKKLLFLGIGSALIVTMGGVGPAQADAGPHINSIQTANADGTAKTVTINELTGSDKCASCHRAHTSQGALNLVTDETLLCATCHGSAAGGASSDVSNGVGYSAAGIRTGVTRALRGGGFVNARIGSDTPTKTFVSSGTAPDPMIPPLNIGRPTTSQHNVGALGTVWGSGAPNPSPTAGGANQITLQCGSCHDPHGNGNYRILRPIPNGSTGGTPFVLKAAVTTAIPAKYNTDGSMKSPLEPVAPAVMSSTKGITVPDEAAPVSPDTLKNYTTANYWLSANPKVPSDPTAVMTGFNYQNNVSIQPDGFIANIAAWCTTCHTRYLATSGSHSAKSGDAIFTYRHRSDANYKANGANCITCHVSHGSNATMTAGGASAGVLMPGGVAAPEGDSRLLRVDNRGICLMCHNK